MSKKKTHEEFVEDLKKIGIYDNIELITSYENSNQKIKYKCKKHNTICESIPYSLQKGLIGCKLCEKEKISLKNSKTNEQFLKECEEKGILNKIKILEEYKGAFIKIKCECLIHKNYTWLTTPDSLLHGHGCPKCGKELGSQKRVVTEEEFRKRLKEINENLELIEGYVNQYSNVTLQCKKCGNVFKRGASRVKQSSNCPFCTDGMSYPNKLLRVMLRKLKPKYYEFEYKRDWTNNRRYDAMFSNSENYENDFILVEAQGTQHYRDVYFGQKLVSCDKSKQSDKEKQRLAKEKGVTILYLDCSDKNYIEIAEEYKKVLGSYFSFDNIDLLKCVKEAQKSLIIQVCENYANDLDISIKQLGEKYKIHPWTVKKYLRLGNELNLCIYPYDKRRKTAGKQRIQNNNKQQKEVINETETKTK